MDTKAFIEFHTPALEADEARHNLLLGVMGRAAADPVLSIRTWTFGPPGACAVQGPKRPIVLGDLDDKQCRTLAEQVQGSDYPGVIGPDIAATWFVERARECGAAFADPMPQQICALRESPRYPGAAGGVRPVQSADAVLLADWLTAFAREAVPNDPPPARTEFEKVAGEGRYLFWTVAGEPVSVAGIARRTRRGASISGVYTPPHLRGRGYAGSVVAAVVEKIYAEGRSMACLYTDLRNPYSNRCYAKIGFKPVCGSQHYPRIEAEPRQEHAAG